MALDAAILRKIRYEIGAETLSGVDDDSTLETIYNDEDEGNSSVLVTALIVWRSRLGNMTDRAFDITTEGSLLSRAQKVRFIERRIKELELLVDDTPKGQNAPVVGAGATEAAITTELS